MSEMNPVCNGCEFQDTNGSGGVQCGKAHYESSPGYGNFLRGHNCINDSGLENLFKPRKEDNREVHNMSSMLERQKDEIYQLKYEKGQLEERLIKINREG